MRILMMIIHKFYVYIYALFDKVIICLRTAVYKEITNSNANNLIIKGKIYFMNKNIIFGNNVTLYPGVTFMGTGKITIGNNVAIGKDSIIIAKEDIEIGDNTCIAGQCFIVDNNHCINKDKLIREQELEVKNKLIIGSDCWIGANSTIIAGAHIEDGAIIGAKALVNCPIKKYSIVVGIPAREIGKRE